MRNTKIDWADHTWNPVTGCKNQCEYCYARSMVNRFTGSRFCEENEDDVLFIQRENSGKAYPFGFAPTLFEYRMNFPQKIKEPSTVFVCSMADLFGSWVPDEWIYKVLDACRAAPQHRYLFLTKNPKRYEELNLPALTNFYYGYTMTNPTADYFERKGFNTLISIEPLLEDFNLSAESGNSLPITDWVIIGAESGRRKNKVTPKRKWIEDIVKDCRLKSTPVFMKSSLVPVIGEENMISEFPW